MAMAARGSEADFLMEQLLDSQEEVAQLHDEVAKWKAAASLRHAASSLNRGDINDIDILLSLRESLNVSLQQLDQDIGRIRATAAGGSDEGLEGSHQSSEAMLMFPKLRYELLLFRNVTELERLYRTGIRIGFDAPRILRLALEKLSQLTNQWALFQQDGNERHVSTGSLRSPVLSLPSYCYSKEWAVPFRKALTEVIISLEMMPHQQNVSLASSRLTLAEDAMRQLRLMGENEKILVELARQTVDFDTDAIREKIKLASSTVSSSLGTSATTAASGASGLPSPSLNMAAGGKQSSNTSAPNSRSGSATGAPSAASIRSNSTKKGVSGRPATMSYLQSIQLGNKRTNSSRSSSAATKPSVDASVMSTSSTASAAARGRSPPRHEFSTMHSAHSHISTEVEAVVFYQPSQQAAVAALPPRAPGGASLGYSTPVPAAQIGGVDSKHPNSRSTSAASLVDSRTASPSNVSVNSSRGVTIGRTTPTKQMDVPRRIVLKSPSPKPNRSAGQRPLAEATIVDHGLALNPGDHFSQAAMQELPPHSSPPQQRASPPRSALKHWADTHEDEHRHHEGGSGKRVTLSVPRNSAQGNDFDLSPQSPATSPPKPLQYYEVIPSRELSAEQPVRRREPQPTKVAPATSTPASHPSPGGRQVRFAGDN